MWEENPEEEDSRERNTGTLLSRFLLNGSIDCGRRVTRSDDASVLGLYPCSKYRY